MTISAGTRLGPYEILAPLGAGGMGEVYKARDGRLNREVAIKVLPASFSTDPDRLRRFEQEAQAAGALNHPNITAVYDIGSHESAPYIVTELLNGETLRDWLAGDSLTPRKAIDIAVQIARGLATAHEKGIVHRDLKPENVFVTKDGRIKILDFGLAKLTQVGGSAGPQTHVPTATAGTEPGVVLGTLGYMSPEQVKGKELDARSDIFSFGTVLYEMLAGKRAFQRNSAAETISAILKEEPPDLSATNPHIGPGLERILRHCLEKNPDERFHSAHDLAFDLETLPGLSGAVVAASEPPDEKRRRWILVAAAVFAAGLVGVATFLATKKAMDRPPPTFQQLTFRRGRLRSARFGPGDTVLYSAAWAGGPMEIYTRQLGSPEARPFGLSGAEVTSISRSGEMLITLSSLFVGTFRQRGTLAQVSASGGNAPRDLLEEVEWADWAPDGKSFAVARVVGGRARIEYPVGKVLYETSGWVSHIRVSPGGDTVAFMDHPVQMDDTGSVAVVDRSGKKKTLSRSFFSAWGLAWSPNNEIWFTAAETGENRDIYSTTLSGRVRFRSRLPGIVSLQDISREGRMLVIRDTVRIEMFALAPGESKERDLTWLDWSAATDISSDGKTVLFAEAGDGGGPGYSVYVRKTDGSPAVRLGEGSAMALSPDGKWALAILHPSSDPQLVAYPTGAGEPRLLPRDGLWVFGARWLPDGRRIVMVATEPGHGQRLYLRDFDGGKPRALSPEGYGGSYPVSPDGNSVVARGPGGKIYLYPISGGAPTPVPDIDATYLVTQFSADSRSLYVARRSELPANVYRLDVASGRKALWRTLTPADPSGVLGASVLPTPGGDAYVWDYSRETSDLYLVDGI